MNVLRHYDISSDAESVPPSRSLEHCLEGVAGPWCFETGRALVAAKRYKVQTTALAETD
jgi:hypothetical protein